MKRICSFVILLAFATGIVPFQCFGADVSEYELQEWVDYHQCTPSPPDRVLDRSIGFQAFVVPAGDGSVVSATTMIPDGLSLALSNNGSAFVLPATPGVTTGLTAERGGLYRFAVETEDGPTSTGLSAPKAFAPIAPLQLLDFPQLSVIDSTQAFTIQWRNPNTAVRNDYLHVEIYETNGAVAYDSGPLRLTTSSVSLPAQLLSPNTTYYVYLRYVHLVSLVRRASVSVSVQVFTTEARLQTLNPAGEFRFDTVFSTNSTSAAEAVVPVERAEGARGDVSVDYFSSDATARSNMDYVAVQGTLKFPDGVAAQSIVVPLLQGTNATATHLILTLTNATGGAGIVARPHKNVELIPDHNEESNIASCVLAKVRFYFQTNAGAATASNLCVASRFYATVTPEYTGGAVAGTLVYPNGQVATLTNNGSTLDFERDFPSPASMNGAYPVGNYIFRFSTRTDGNFRMAQTLGVERMIPVPHIANWDEAQSVDASQPFILKWDRFASATTNDVVRVGIRDAHQEYVVDTPGLYARGALDGSTTNYTIAANRLSPGERYSVDVIFERPIPTKNAPKRGMLLGFNTVRTTSFYLNTVAPSIEGAVVSRRLPAPASSGCPCEAAGHVMEHDPDSP